jgi:peptidoglycan/LPS O-acetylase OafA/YrhL
MFGTYGVSMFFILSGYSLAHAYGRRFSGGLDAAIVGAYFRRRFARLAPLFGSVVLLSLAGRALAGRWPDPLPVLANLLLVFGLYDPAATPVVGGWSIGVEVVFYILFPLATVFRARALWMIVVAVLLTTWISVDLQRHASLEQGWSSYVLPANQWVFFVAGIFLRLGLRSPRPAMRETSPTLRSRALVAAVVALLFGAMLLAGAGASELALVTGWRRAVLVVASIAIVAALGTWPINGAWAAVATWLGGLSYPLYLLHPLVFFGLRRWIDVGSALQLAGLFVLSVVLATIVDRALDAPLQRKLKAAGW